MLASATAVAAADAAIAPAAAAARIFEELDATFGEPTFGEPTFGEPTFGGAAASAGLLEQDGELDQVVPTPPPQPAVGQTTLASPSSLQSPPAAVHPAVQELQDLVLDEADMED